MKINFIDLQRQYQKYKQEIDQEIHNVLDTSEYIMGSKIDSFERKLEDFIGCKHAIVCSSGTDALLLALMALDIKTGDEIITSPFTFIATAEMIAFIGAVPVFVDIDEKTFNLDTTQIEAKITSRTKAIMPIALFGQPAEMDNINNIAKKYSLKVIEDAAQSFGATYKGKRSCGLADVGCTSFFPAKPLGCYGDGGAVFTDDDKLASKIRIILNHGQTKKYIHSCIGINGRLDTMQVAILDVKLKYYEKEIEKRQVIAQRYNDQLNNVVLPFIASGNKSVWAQYCIRVKNRDKVIEQCTLHGVPTAIYYPIPLHLQEAFSFLNHVVGDFPITEKVSQDILALPMSAFLTSEEQRYIIGVVNDC